MHASVRLTWMIVVLTAAIPAVVTAATSPRTVAATASIVLMIDGYAPLHVRSAAGGNAYAEVRDVRTDRDASIKESGSVRYAELTIAVSLADVDSLVRDALGGRRADYNGRLLVVDADGMSRVQLEFTSATLTEVVFPKLEATARGPVGDVKLVLQPQSSRTTYAAIRSSLAPRRPVAAAAAMRVSLDGANLPQVHGVESFAVTRPVGGSSWSASNLILTVDPSQAKTFADWFDARARTSKKAARIELLSRETTPILSLDASSVGIVAVRHDRAVGEAAQAQVECFVERWAIGR